MQKSRTNNDSFRLSQGTYSFTNQMNRGLGLPYFEGWYHKIHISELQVTAICIFGRMAFKGKKSSFVQVATSNDMFSTIYEYPFEDLVVKNNHIEVNKHSFSSNHLKVELPDFSINITSNNNSNTTIKSAIGLKKFVPFVNCKHEVLLDNKNANLDLNTSNLSYSGTAHHYLETSWGNTFPDEYYWLHAHSFNCNKTSFFIAQGTPRFMGIPNQQFMGYLKTEKETYIFHPRNSKLAICSQTKKIQIQAKKTQVLVTYSNGTPISLLAPFEGELSHPVVEHVNVSVGILLKNKRGTEEYYSKAGSWENN